MQQQTSNNCGAFRPTHIYPLPSQTYTRGLPTPMVAHPPGMTMCQVRELQKACRDRINEYRAGRVRFSDGRTRNHGRKSNHTFGPQAVDKCMNEKATSDLRYAVHRGQGCGHFTSRLNCNTGKRL